ncbi:MAG: maleylpyruvate isomerase N-terminal domain-containing protein [Anaerolineales bacterium]|nr:maleylpyruvate isomerase N-terminal domain-containing protein [Anaerolineales bacterium]
MKELNEYRRHLMNRLLSATKEFRDACLAVKDLQAPLDEGGWNVHQIATHTRDVHMLVYRFRAQRTAEDEDPEFQNFDGDAYMAEHYDANKPLKQLLDGFVASVESLLITLGRLPAEAWSRTSRHVTLGSGFTLQTWIERDLAHIEEHLKIVKKGE